ncbi:MAG: Ig-like domain-containing protein [Anaerolineales bacterium]|nr:Ig-like domain-containing protein [Anaerolineales bacterium]
MRKFAAVLLFIPLLLLTLQPIACGGSTGPALEIPPTPTEEGMATETAVPTPTLRPTHTPVPETLAATLVETFPLDNYPASVPITIQFNQPMAPGSLKMPLLISPSAAGETAWNNDFTSFTFTPSRGFLGQVSTLTLHSGLHSADGKTFAQPQRWRLHHAAAPVVRHTPSETRITDPQLVIEVRFDTPMIRASVEEALSVAPTIPFTMNWLADDHLTLTLAEPLAFASVYEFRLAKTAVSTAHIPLKSDAVWRYQLADPVAKVEITRFPGQGHQLDVQFNYPMNSRQVESVVRLSPEIAGRWVWNGAKTAVSFTPDAGTFGPGPYKLAFTDNLELRDGTPLPAPNSRTLQIPTAVLAVSPIGFNANPFTNIVIVFDRPVDHASVEAALTIQPATDGTFAWDEETLTFSPENDFLKSYTEYTIAISPDALAANGQPLFADAYQHRFQTERVQPAVSFGYGAHVQLVDANGRRALQFSSKTGELTAVLSQLTLSQWMARYGNGFAGAGGWYGEEFHHLNTTDLPVAAEWSVTAVAGTQELLLPADVAPGFYLLGFKPSEINDQLFVIISSYTMMIKEGQGARTIWVSDINGASQPNATVTLYNEKGQPLAEAATNEMGIARFPATEAATFAVAHVNGELTVMGLNDTWRSGSSWYGWWGAETAVKSYAAHIYTDRPIYQPGQTVFYKAVIRQDDDAELSLLPAGTAVTVTIHDARNNTVQTSTLQTNHFGTINGQFALADGAMMGTYKLAVLIDGEQHEQWFKVEEYHKPDYEVTLTADNNQQVAGQPIVLTVDAHYFLGESVPNATVTINTFRLYENYDWEYYGGDPYYWSPDYGTSLRGTTDENGRLTLTFSTSRFQDSFYNNTDWEGNWQPIPLALEATVDDGSHQTVSATTIVRLAKTAERITLNRDYAAYRPNDRIPLVAQVQTLTGEPVNGRQLTLNVRSYTNATGTYSNLVKTTTTTTAADGRATASITIPAPGFYQIEVAGKDALGNPIAYKTYRYVYSGKTDGWQGRGSENLTVTLDRENYAPGDVAKLLIESSFAGPALITFERATVRREQLVTLTPPLTIVEIPVQRDDTPNIYVTVNAWQPQDTSSFEQRYTSIPDSLLRRATVNLSVPARDKQLQVTLTADKPSYAPGAEASFTVRVTNRAGVPVSAEVSLALVDEAIFALSDLFNGPIYDSFYYERSNAVATYDALAPQRYLNDGGMGGGGGGGYEDGNPRTDFPDTAAWFPVLHTDYNGEATVTLTMPDSLTSWRLTAVATTTDTQVGEAFINVQTKQAIVIQPILPEGLTAGDRVQLSTLVQNFSDAPQTITVEVVETAVSPHISFPQTIAQSVTIPPGQREIVGWSVFAGVAGTATLQFNARVGEQLVDAIALPLEIRPLSIPDVTTQIADFQGEWTTTLNQLANALPQSSVKIELSRSIAGSMTEGLDYLTGYPYGCVEQTMSRALPNAVVSRAFFQLGIGSRDPELEAKINASVQRLYGFQHNDGGWGWWFDDRTDAYQTAWVLFGLALVEDAGHEVDPLVLERGAAWLNDALPQMDQRVRAFALYSLSLAGQANEGATLRAYERDVAQLDTFGKTALALALHAQGETAKGQELLDGVVETAVSANNLVHWSGANHDGEYSSKTMASDVRTTALVVSALAQMRPGTATETAAVRWLMTQRRAQGWGTTNETSFAILALTDHLLATSFAENGTTPYTVLLNDETIFTGTLGPGQPSVSLEIPAEQLHTGANRLLVRQEAGGNGRLYLTLNHRVYLAQTEIAAAGVVKIERSYVDVKTGKVLTAVNPGQLVRVQLRVTLPRNAAYMLVEDMLPGGLEPLNEKLNTSSRVGLHNQEPEYRWQQFGYNYKEVHRDRVTFFITEMDSSLHTFT